jgi:riboflavin synthase
VFTGLIGGVGRVARIERLDDGVRLAVSSSLADELKPGDSVAVNGVCLTAAGVNDGAFEAEVMNETLARSSLGALELGTGVNLELPLRVGDPLGGHLVQGHVDGVGVVLAFSEDGFARRLQVEPPAELMRYIVEKGSITVDGVSLTVAECDKRSFTVSLIPETLDRTNLAAAVAGTRVNLEVDVLAKYVEKAVRG